MLATTDLTPSERLHIHRRRMNLNQSQAAEHWQVNPWTYRMWESGLRTTDIPTPALGRLLSHESCFIARRRLGMSRSECARSIGISNYWLTLMERGDISADRLVAFWN